MLRTLITDAEKVAKEQVHAFAETERRAFVQRIESQRFDSFTAFPLSWRTRLRKRRLRLSQKVMIATREYIRAIKIYEERIERKDGIGPNGKPSSSGTRVIVGIHPNKKARDPETNRLRWDVPLQFVAKIHEFGAPRAGIPARPHWWPHYLVMHANAGKVRQRIAQLVADRWKTTMGTNRTRK